MKYFMRFLVKTSKNKYNIKEFLIICCCYVIVK